MMRELI